MSSESAISSAVSALDRRQRGGAELQRAHVAGQQPHGGGGDDEHDGDEQRADGVERDDHRDRHGGQQHAVGERRADPERAGAARVEAGRQPGAVHRAVGRERRDDRGGREPHVALAEPDQRAEQQLVDARAGLVDVGGEHARRRPAPRPAAARWRRRGPSGARARGARCPPRTRARPRAPSAAAPRPTARRRPGRGTSPSPPRACRRRSGAARSRSRAPRRAARAAASSAIARCT